MALKFNFQKYFLELNLELPPKKIQDIEVYINEINSWNRKADLTSIEGNENIFINLFIDAFTLAPYIKNGTKIIDIGTGGGFPGLALKLLFRDINLTLIDSSSKKCLFLKHISELLQFENVEVLWKRAEDLGKDISYREKYDFACCRAVSTLSAISELCLPFVKVGGKFIASKGKDLNEIKETEPVIALLGGVIEKIEKIKYPFFNEEKNIVIIHKNNPTPGKYPRRTGIPQKRPLKI